jgi:hypothetical protein
MICRQDVIARCEEAVGGLCGIATETFDIPHFSTTKIKGRRQIRRRHRSKQENNSDCDLWF